MHLDPGHVATDSVLRLSISLTYSDTGQSVGLIRPATAFSALLTTQHPNDVMFSFPRAGKRTLWANSKVLALASPYFASLFSPSWAEGSFGAVGRDDKSGSEASDGGPEFEESDDELEVSTNAPPKTVDFPSPTHDSYQVVISTTSYATYHAVLCYIHTSYIYFAPLTSTFRQNPPRAISTAKHDRHAMVTKLAAARPGAPPPISPKSVYRLADLLELTELKQIALREFKASLTAGNVAYELYGDVSACYPEIRSAALDFAANHWEEVQTTAAMQELKPGDASIMWELASRLRGPSEEKASEAVGGSFCYTGRGRGGGDYRGGRGRGYAGRSGGDGPYGIGRGGAGGYGGPAGYVGYGAPQGPYYGDPGGYGGRGGGYGSDRTE